MGTDSTPRKLVKSEITTIRLDPKLKYLAELAARKHRRTLSSYVEWAVEQSLATVVVKEYMSHKTTVADEAPWLWDIDEPDRLAKLALRYPDLLTHEEQQIWKVAVECDYFWRGRFNDENGEWLYHPSEDSIIFSRLREKWATLKAVARGDEPVYALPGAVRKPSDAPASSGFDDMDPDIPF